jgi:hypothetical protein
MKSPAEKYKTLSRIDNIKDIAYEVLFTRYITRNLKGDSKVLDIDSTDQESLMTKINGGFPLPGFIYTFMYPKKDGLVQMGNGEEYIDFVPLVFCLGVKGKIFKGINLNTLPYTERVKFLEIYWKSYKDFFIDIEDITENNKLAINMKFISLMTAPIAGKILEVMSNAAGANFSYGFRSYDAAIIKQLRMVEYSEWEYIPFYEPKNAFKGMNQKQIHTLYYRTNDNKK